MIVVCEQCSTRFQLDESRIPARGAQVRCSRCKHAFFVAPGGASPDQVVQDVVAEATGPGGSTAPTVTTDLDSTLLDSGAGARKARDEDEWEFNEDPPAGSKTRPAPPSPAPELEIDRPKEAEPAGKPEVKQAEGSPMDELGDPEDWDFGGGDGGGAAAAPVPTAGKKEPASERAAEPPKAAQVAAEPAARPKVRAAHPRRRSTDRMSSLLLEVVGYLALALLFGTGVARVVERAVRTAPPTTMLSAALLPVSANGADHVRVDFLENVLVGNLVVISGRQTAEQPGTGLEVEWMAHGAPIPGSATLAGPAIPAAWLREADPAQLRTILAEAAARPDALPGGAPPGGVFVAVYEAVPQGATALRVRPVTLPGAPQTVGGGQDAARPAPQGEAPAGSASPSSPPSPRPSSE